MRLAVCVIVGLLVLLGLAPYGFGLRAHTIISSIAAQLAQGWHVPVVMTAYQRGWFSSTAAMQLPVSGVLAALWRVSESSTEAAQDEATLLQISQRILHGPFPLSTAVPSMAGLAPVQALLQSTVRPVLSGTAPVPPGPETIPVLHVTTTVFLSGASQSRVFIPAFVTSTSTARSAPLVWNGLRGEVQVSQRGDQVLSALRAPGLYVKQARTQMSLQNVLLRLETHSEQHQALHGQVMVSLDSLEIGPEAEAQAEWSVQDGEGRTRLALAGEMVQADVDVQCALCRFANAAAGQGSAHLEARRLSLPVLLRLGQEVATLWPEEPDMRTLWLRLVLSGELTAALAALARSSPTLALTQARLRTPEGDVAVTAHLQLDAERARVAERLSLLVQSIDAEATLEAPVDWVQELAVAQAVRFIRERSDFGAFLSLKSLRTMAAIAVDKYLRNLVAQGYLNQEGGRYRSRARYTQGQLLINEQPVALPMLIPW